MIFYGIVKNTSSYIKLNTQIEQINVKPQLNCGFILVVCKHLGSVALVANPI